ncbi:hypothetical protein [Sporocytophaga myxococcoides]|uniref:hypothetical protein n=1 Tax=Sporocytophaga myxococcoides TaxID=153721 RepID=UPI000490C3AD|nr:hypothetical protein [Sporocytophaga myxococcoides]
MSNISKTNLYTASPYLYLQAAGSDGSDGTSEGIHLRWEFDGYLGEQHIPKGNYAGPTGGFPADFGFNKSNDFVKIYRSAYTNRYAATVDFSSMLTNSSQLVESGEIREWTFNTTPVSQESLEKCYVKVRFLDTFLYDDARALINPVNNAVNFLKSYRGAIQITADGHLCFRAELEMKSINTSASALLRVEAISGVDQASEENDAVTYRKSQSQEATSAVFFHDIVSERIRTVTFTTDNCYPVIVKLETYFHYISGVNHESGGWTSVKDLSLSLDNTEVHNRLDSSTLLVDGRWPKYNGGAKVKVNNYKDKWERPGKNLLDPYRDEDLKDGVTAYLLGSMDPDNVRVSRLLGGDKALPDLKISQNPPDEEGWIIGNGARRADGQQFEVSMQSMLRMAAVDFHVARMLGFGHIDNTGLASGTSTKYIYLAVYTTLMSAEDGVTSVTKDHAAMCLPTSKADFRYPEVPKVLPITYGLKFDTGTGQEINLTDEEGYAQQEAIRYININIDDPAIYEEPEAFFIGPEFTTHDKSESVGFGIEYKRITPEGQPDWVVPEISHDEDFLDANENPEPVPVLFGGSNPLYVHKEIEEGVHQYAVYGINTFSRISASQVTNQTNNTDFPSRNTIIPPLNLAAHLVQEEGTPLLFTTASEQTALAALNEDSTLLRVTFNWNHINNMNQAMTKTNGVPNKATKVQFLFHKALPESVRGKVKSVLQLEDGRIKVTTEGYKLYSSGNDASVNPVLAPEDYPFFKGSVMVIDKADFIVKDVETPYFSSEGPVFYLAKKEERTIEEPDNDNTIISPIKSFLPKVGDRFLVPRNMAEKESWNYTLNKEVAIHYFSEHTELVTDSDGNQTNYLMGGIAEPALIEEKKDKGWVYNDSLKVNVEAEIEESRTGVFTITFDGNPLTAHADPDFEWYQGVVRIEKENDSAEKKELQVININNSGADLVITVYDADFKVDPTTYNPINGYEPIKTGTVFVNFHPGYRLYLNAERDSDFVNSNLVPSSGSDESLRTTVFAARAVDARNGQTSYISSPVPVIGRRIIKAAIPENPEGPSFATRPDFYGKSTYTFDTPMNVEDGRKPFALVFYRGNHRSILDVLYKRETVAQILIDLNEIVDDTMATAAERWRNLVNVKTYSDESGEGFEVVNGYGFQKPDNPAYRIPSQDPNALPVYPFAGSYDIEEAKDIIRRAIESVFVPLTEQPVLYSHIKEGKQTSQRPPKIRNSNDERLSKEDAEYDPYPMVVKLPGEDKVRFTDYKIDGAATESWYFYFVKEITDALVQGGGSDMLGPVRLIDAYAPAAPAVTGVFSRPENPVIGESTAVRFTVNPYLEAENITAFRIYRTTDRGKATSVRTMDLAAEINATDQLEDTFTNLDFPPFGENIYYRIVALRNILNESDEEELVPSEASGLILASVIDVVNPAAPELSFEAAEITETQLIDVTLKWSKTTHNGKYYLYKMTDSGNWNKIHEVKTNDAEITFNAGTLEKLDDEDSNVYHRYKVDVENASGLLNTEEKALTIQNEILPSQYEGLSLWLSADKLEGLEDGDPVAEWQDRSLNRNHAVEVDPLNNPVYREDAGSGYPAVEFAGSQYLVSSDSIDITGSKASTIFFVAEASAAGDRTVLYIGDAAGTNAKTRIYAANDSLKVSFNNGYRTFSNGLTALDEFNAVSFRNAQGANYGQYQAFLNNTSLTENSVSADTTVPNTSGDLFYIGASRSAGVFTSGAFMKGSIAEIIVYNRALNDHEVEDIFNYINNKYNLY